MKVPEKIGKYEVHQCVGRGSMGIVFAGHDPYADRKVAIKVMREGPFAGARDKARFEREIQVLGALKHPNIVAIHDSGQEGGSFYYVMDYISGQRFHPDWSRVGGAMQDLPDEETFKRMVKHFIDERLPSAMKDLETLLNRNRIFIDRVAGVHHGLHDRLDKESAGVRVRVVPEELITGRDVLRVDASVWPPQKQVRS